MATTLELRVDSPDYRLLYSGDNRWAQLDDLDHSESVDWDAGDQTSNILPV